MFCGIDEAGRGCIAGPLVVAGVVLKSSILGLNDSKKLSKKKREELFAEIIKHSDYHIVSFSAKKVDELGISKCLHLAIKEIISVIKADKYLMDGNSNFHNPGVKTEVKADAKYMEVSAASILAKVTKDRSLIQEGEKYPDFSFSSHQGYGTKKHIQEIKEFGYTPLHRQTFRIKTLETPSLFGD